MARNKWFLLVLFLIPAAAFPVDETRILAKDDRHQYTFADLKAYLTATNDSISDIILKAAESPSNAPGKTLLEETLKSLAFKRVFVEQELQKRPPDEGAAFKTRDILRQYAARLNQADVLKECEPTTNELQLAYEQNKASYQIKEKRKIAVLYKVFPEDRDKRQKLVESLEELRAKPDFKEKFTDYVKKHSDLPGALDGGIVNYFSLGEYGPTVEKFAFETPKGELSPVFTAKSGAYIIKCLDAIPGGGVLSLQEAAPQLKTVILKKKMDAALNNNYKLIEQRNKITYAKPIPETGPAKTLLLTVNNYTVTSGTLAAAYPEKIQQFTYNAPDLIEYLRKLAREEALLQELEKSPRAAEVEWLRITNQYRIMFSESVRNQIKFDEKEARDYYQQKKEFYHGPTPKRLVYILFKRPDDKKLAPANYHKILTEQQRTATAFRDKIVSNPDDFIKAAKEFSKQSENISYQETDWMEELPNSWKHNTSLIEYPKGKISPLFMTEEGFIVFKVIDETKPRILPYDEVKDKARRVVIGMKEMNLSKEIQKMILQEKHFQIIDRNNK